MANKGKKIARRTPQELLQAQQLAFAKTVLKANGYVFYKEGEKTSKGDKEGKAEGKKDTGYEFSTFPALFKHIRKHLKLAEELIMARPSMLTTKDRDEMIEDIVANLKPSK